MGRKILLSVFSFYQRWIRMLLPQGRCIFEPSCSDYAMESIKKYGAWKGGYYAMLRVLRCHPFSKGGLDPVP